MDSFTSDGCFKPNLGLEIPGIELIVEVDSAIKLFDPDILLMDAVGLFIPLVIDGPLFLFVVPLSVAEIFGEFYLLVVIFFFPFIIAPTTDFTFVTFFILDIVVGFFGVT